MQIKDEIVLYQPNAEVQLEVQIGEETVWLTQEQIAMLFGTQRPAITKHLNNIYKSGELDLNSTCSILERMGNDGRQRYQTKYYNLDAILSVGYRVNSYNATQFRRWATKVLKEYMLKGYAVNQRFEKLEQRVAKAEEQIDFFVRTNLPPKEGILFDGQIFDAYELTCRLIKSAQNRIVLFDNYIDETVLTLLDKRAEGVTAKIYTNHISRQLSLDFEKHNAQYAPVEVELFDRSHDRFLCIDDIVYHLGASLKDLGKRWFAFNRMEITADELLKKI